jgi:hypothetical protein
MEEIQNSAITLRKWRNYAVKLILESRSGEVILPHALAMPSSG